MDELLYELSAGKTKIMKTNKLKMKSSAYEFIENQNINYILPPYTVLSLRLKIAFAIFRSVSFI